MIDPRYFEEPRFSKKAILGWLYDNEMIEWRDRRLQLTDKAGVYLAFLIFGLGFFFVA